MPVTTYPAAHKANAITSKPGQLGTASSTSELLERSCRKEFEGLKNNHIIQSSFAAHFATNDTTAIIRPSHNGFVHAAIDAYSDHRHLVLRPDDVWLAVLTQLSLYINRNAETLRGQFVAHEGQKELKVIEVGTLRTVDFGVLAYCMGREIEANVVDPTLRNWIMPDFSTTTPHDAVVASVVFMGAMQKYFSYTMQLACGLPSVTLLGEKADWQKLLARLDKLSSLGAEAEQWRTLLAPVFRRFVETFDAPESDGVRDFWQRIAHHSGGGSGPSYYSGWITAFCFWDEDGNALYRADAGGKPWNAKSMELLSLDGAAYHYIRSNDVSPGYASVPVKVDDNGVVYSTAMVAGSVGSRMTSSGEPSSNLGAVGLDTLEPVSGWWIFEQKSQEELDEDKRIEREAQEAKFQTWKAQYEENMAKLKNP